MIREHSTATSRLFGACRAPPSRMGVVLVQVKTCTTCSGAIVKRLLKGVEHSINNIKAKTAKPMVDYTAEFMDQLGLRFDSSQVSPSCMTVFTKQGRVPLNAGAANPKCVLRSRTGLLSFPLLS